MIPQPFNSVDALVHFTCFSQGDDAGQDGVKQGTFVMSAFSDALQRARSEIFARCGRKGNDEYEDWRKAQLTEAELWLATARLYPQFGERIAIKFPESNLSSVQGVSIGADTPSPVEKGVHWVEFMTTRFRAMGLELMLGQGMAWTIDIGKEPEHRRFGCLGKSHSIAGGECQCQR